MEEVIGMEERQLTRVWVNRLTRLKSWVSANGIAREVVWICLPPVPGGIPRSLGDVQMTTIGTRLVDGRDVPIWAVVQPEVGSIARAYFNQFRDEELESWVMNYC